MNLQQLQTLSLMTRKSLARLYDKLAVYKVGKRRFDDAGYTTLEYAYHNKLTEIKREIAKLVTIQKALKKDISSALQWQRMATDFKKRSKARREVVAAKWAAEENAAKMAAMERAGECYGAF